MTSTRAGFEFDSRTYHASSATYQFEYDPVETPPCMAVVSALSAVLDVDPTDMDPIAESVNTDGLDALVRDFDPANGDIEVSWTQAGYDVTVSSEGTVTASPEGGDSQESSTDR